MRHRLISGLLSLVVGVFSVVTPAAVAGEGRIAVDDAYTAAKAGKLLIIDVRTPGEWRQTGIAEGAKTVDVNGAGGDAFFVAAVNDLVASDKGRPLAVICRSGNRSTRARGILLANGFSSVLNIQEGMAGGAAGPGWLSRGLPVTPCPQC